MSNADMQALLAQFKRLGLDEGQGMRLLGDSNTISDNCIKLLDIYESDVPAALAWLKKQKV